MKVLLVGALSLGVIAFASSAWADDHHHGGGGGGGHQTHQSHGGGGGHGSHSSGHVSFHASGGSHAVVREHFTHHHNSVHVSVHHGAVTHHSVGHVTVHGGVHHGVLARTNVAHFHHVFRAPHRYHIAAWHAPRGFHYRRFGIGERIPAILLVSAYFIDDYYDYYLDEPDDGYVWVRDGDDAVLVDRYTGEVVEVEYDVFY